MCHFSKIGRTSLVKQGYGVQTFRITTNSFTKYLVPDANDNCNGNGNGNDNDNGNTDGNDNLTEFQRRLDLIDSSLYENQVEFRSIKMNKLITLTTLVGCATAFTPVNTRVSSHV